MAQGPPEAALEPGRRAPVAIRMRRGLLWPRTALPRLRLRAGIPGHQDKHHLGRFQTAWRKLLLKHVHGASETPGVPPSQTTRRVPPSVCTA